jgi:transcriptional regulator with XRE-family HTH domain
MTKGTAGINSAGNENSIGRRLLELRLWRKKSLRAVAGLAGCSAAYLSLVENGKKIIDSRSLLDRLATALEVAPSEILAEPLPAQDPVSREAHADMERINAVLAHNRLWHPYREQLYPWPQLEADLRLFTGTLVPACDYVRQAQMLPDLIERLYTTHATETAHRRDALIGLMFTLQHTAALLKNLGAHSAPYLAAMHMRYVSDELEDAAWSGVAEWRVGQSSGGDRPRMLAVSIRAADKLQGNADQRAVAASGMLHLNAAFASAAMRCPDDARAHLAEAHEMVRVVEGTSNFADMHFNAANWTVWRVAIGVELGEGPKVAEYVRDLDVSLLSAAERRAMLYGDMGRGLAQGKATRAQAVEMLRTAEKIAPQRIRTHPFIKETVSDLMRRAQRDAVGRELRGMAYRMGLAV